MKVKKKILNESYYIFKKIEIWILYLVVLLGIPITIGFGILVKHEMLGGKKLGRIPEFALFLTEIPTNIKKILFYEKEQNQRFADRFPLLDGFNGTPNLNQSYLLLTKYDGDLKEGIVELVDLMNFKVLHTWNPDIDEFNKSIKEVDQFKNIKKDAGDSRVPLRHPKLTRDGGLLFHSGPLRKIDSCSNLIFENENNMFSHSIETTSNGDIWVPFIMYPQSLSIQKVGRDIIYEGGYYDSAIIKLSSDGEILFKKSVSQIFIDNGLEYLLFSVGGLTFTKDPLHLNDIQPVDFDGEFWKKGDIFLSLRHQSMVLLYRPSTNKIIWKGTGPFFHQHDVDILNDYAISVFNNNSKDFVGGDVVDGHNEVVIYDFKQNEYSSYLRNSLIENDVRTITEGRSQILPNGDLLVEESNYARTLYFNSDGSLRWTHVNRAENGKVYRISWSRILYSDNDIQSVKNFLQLRNKCND